MASDVQGDPMTSAVASMRLPDRFGYTTADLHALPDDGRRWELIDGSLIVSPSGTIDHNSVAGWLAQLLEEANPSNEFVIGTGQSATVDDHNELRPDVIVAPA